MKTIRSAAGLIAAVLLAAWGTLVLVFAGQHVLGAAMMLFGAATAVWQGKRLWESRQDPYDLSKLWDQEPDPDAEPDEDWEGDRDTVYCYNCGHAVAEPFARCPECGLQLR